MNDNVLSVARCPPICERRNDFRATTTTFLLLCSVLFLDLLVAAPVLVWIKGFASVILPVALGLVILLIPVYIELFRVHRRLYPKDRGERCKLLAVMVLAPPSPIRATDLAARNLLTDFHPLAVGAERPTKPVFRDYVRRGVLNFKFPLAAAHDGQSGVAADTREWFAAVLATQLRTAIGNWGIDVGATDEAARAGGARLPVVLPALPGVVYRRLGGLRRLRRSGPGAIPGVVRRYGYSPAASLSSRP